MVVKSYFADAASKNVCFTSCAEVFETKPPAYQMMIKILDPLGSSSSTRLPDYKEMK